MEVRDVQGIKVVDMDKRFDTSIAKDVDDRITALIDDGAAQIVCNLSDTDYISSAGLRVLLSAAKRLKKAGGEIALCSLKTYVDEVLETAGFKTIFKIFGSEEDALNSF